MKRLLPPGVIGIIGGGQLGQMMTLSAKSMGYKVIVLDPEQNCPASQVSDLFIQARYDDVSALQELSKCSDVVTYEFENVDVDTVASLEDTYNFPQGSKCLRISQHRIREKDFAVSLDIPCPAYASIKNKEDLKAAADKIGYPCILKTCRFGYDGKGQMKLSSQDDLDKAEELIRQECILEECIPFEEEISLTLSRNEVSAVTFPIPRNVHINGILHTSSVPSAISDELEETAKRYGLKIAEKLNYCGTMAIEFFVREGKLYFNEMAPRPHNSAHYTIEGCTQSQFDTHIKAICELPMHDVKLKQPTLMVNLLGQHVQSALDYISQDAPCDAALHLYGKKESRRNRKMGHLTLFGPELTLLEKEAEKIQGDDTV